MTTSTESSEDGETGTSTIWRLLPDDLAEVEEDEETLYTVSKHVHYMFSDEGMWQVWKDKLQGVAFSFLCCCILSGVVYNEFRDDQPLLRRTGRSRVARRLGRRKSPFDPSNPFPDPVFNRRHRILWCLRGLCYDVSKF